MTPLSFEHSATAENSRYVGHAEYLQAENKTLQDAEKQNHEAWDAKYEEVLWQLQDYQVEKDHPQAQVVNIEVDELYDKVNAVFT